MAEKVFRILVLSQDPDLFPRQENITIGDSRQRHIYYCEELRKLYPGSEIRIITYTTKGFGKNAEEPSPGMILIGTSSSRRLFYFFGIIKCLPSILKHGWRPNLITVQTPWEEGLIGWLIARIFRANFLPQLHFDLFSAEWLNEHPINRWRRMLGKFILRRGDRIRTVSNLLRNKIIDECGVSSGRVVVAPVAVNFVPELGDKRAFKSQLDKGLAESKVVLFVGRLCAAKNLPLWVAVAAQITERIEDVRFIIVGDGPEETILRKCVAKAGLTDRFVFVGPKRHHELPVIYAAADVFLLTSHYEGFGRVVLEALMSAVPVVSTACVGPEDIINHGSDGFLLPCGDARGLASKVVYLLENRAEAQAFGLHGQRRVKETFGLQALAHRMIDSWVAA